MHRALKIPEIVDLVCKEAQCLDLTALARTSRDFSDHALDRIWSTTYFHDILNLFPEDLLVEKAVPGVNLELLEGSCLARFKKQFSFRREPCCSDWTRFHLYAKRIRKLSGIFGIASGPAPVTEEVFGALLAQSKRVEGLALFPNLKVLEFDCAKECLSFWEVLSMFLVPGLGAFTLDLSEANQDPLDIQQLVARLPSNCPRLSSFRLKDAITPKEAARTTISSALKAWSGLRNVSISCLDESAISHLSTLPHLRLLRLLDVDIMGVGDLPNGDLFSALQVLDVGAPSGFIIGLLDSIGSNVMTNLSLTIRDESPCSQDIWKNIVSSVVSSASGNTITNLLIGDRPQHNPDTAVPSLPLDGFQALLSMRQLRDVRLYPKNDFDLDNDGILKIVKAWPSLRELKLGNRAIPTSPGTNSRVTLEGLAHLAEHCPNLWFLGIRFDALLSELLPPVKPANGKGLRMVHIKVHDCTITSPVHAVASYMSCIFPSLKLIQTDNPVNASLWHVIQELVIHFRHARKQERGEVSPKSSNSEQA